MKKIIVMLLTISMVVGCACASPKASDAVKEYLNKFNNLHASVMEELNDLINKENLMDEQGKNYEEIMKKQYKDLKYEIVEETYDGDMATVKTNITVYDLYKAQKEAEEYRNNHQSDFLDEEKKPSSTKFLEYKLEQMKKTDTKVTYTIDFKVEKKDGKWVLSSVTTETLEKIHGIYNYQND